MIINFRDFLINFDKIESIEKRIAFWEIYLPHKIYRIYNEKDYEVEWNQGFPDTQYSILPEEDFKDFCSLLREWSDRKYGNV